MCRINFGDAIDYPRLVGLRAPLAEPDFLSSVYTAPLALILHSFL